MKRAPAILIGLVAVVVLVTGPFVFSLPPVSADAGIKGQWTTLANGDDIRGLAVTYTHVWAGTHNGGAVSWSLDDGIYTQYLAPQTGLAGNDVRAVDTDKYIVWFATNKGVSQFEPDTNQWFTYTTANGLPSNNATAVAHGPDGRLWVGTSQTWAGSEWVGGGLSVCEINGNCTTYTVADGLPSNNVTDIAFDSVDVWVGTRPYKVFVEETGTTAAHWVDEGGGVALLSGGQWETFTSSDSQLSDNRINAVATATNGRVWFATPSGLVVYDRSNDSWRTYKQELGSDAVRDVAVDGSNRVWAATYDSESTPVGALYRLEGDTWMEYDDGDGLSSQVLWTVLPDDQGRVWVGTGPWCKDKTGCKGGGLTRFRPADNSWQVFSMAGTHLASNQITDVAVTDDDALWIATRGSGVSHRDAAGIWHHYTLENSDLTSNIVSTIAIDTEGAVWIGTQQYVADGDWTGGGISVYRDGVWTTYTKSSTDGGLPTNEILAIQVNSVDKLVYVGTGDRRDNSGAGLAVYDPALKAWTTYTVQDGLPSNLIGDIAFDTEQDRVWVATGPYLVGGSTGGGLAVFDDGNWTSYTSANSDVPTWSGDNVTGDFRAIVVDDDGDPWAGTYDTQGFISEEWPYVDALIAHQEGGQWYETKFPEHGFMSSLLLDSDGNLWAGIGQDSRGDQLSRGGLRARINGTWTAATVATSDLAGNDVTALALTPDGDLWIGTANAGLSLLQNAQPGATPTNTLVPTHTPAATETSGPAPTITNTPIPVTPTPGTVSPPAEVPEAATLILVGTGLAGLGSYAAYRWRSRNGKRDT